MPKSSLIFSAALIAGLFSFAAGLQADIDPQPGTATQGFIPAQPSSPLPGRNDPAADPPQAEQTPVQRDYDRFADQNTVKVEGIRPTILRGESRLFLNASSIFDGTEVTSKPDKIALNLLCVSDDFQFGDICVGAQRIISDPGADLALNALDYF